VEEVKMDVEAKRWPTFPALRALHLIVPKIFETSRKLVFRSLKYGASSLEVTELQEASTA
jgi:hypothetical protein